MTDKNAPGRGELAGTTAFGSRRSRVAFVLLLAALLAVTVVFGLKSVPEGYSHWLVIAGAVLALVGLVALFGLLAGLFHIGGGARDRIFFDSLVDTLGDAIVVTDARGRAVYANGPFLKLASKSESGRLVGMDVLFAGYPEFAAPIYQLFQAVQEGKSEMREMRLAAGGAAPCASPDHPVWVRVSVAPAKGAGPAAYRVWRLEDISADRARQEQAFSRLQFIITYLDNAPAGFFSTLSDGHVDYINATLVQWLGHDMGETSGSGLKLADVVGESGARLIAGVEAKPESSITESFSLDLRNIKTGDLMPVQVIHHVDYAADGSQSPSRTLVIPRSLGGGSSAGDEISAPRLSRFINNAPIGIAEVDKDGMIRMANSAFIDLSDKARRSAALALAIIESERPQLEEALTAALSGEGSLHDVEATLEGEKPRSVLFSFTRLAADDDTAVVFAVDKTKSQALEVQLAQSQKMQAVGQLASGIAHDFNNVLTPIIGFADLLLAKMRPTDPAFADVMNIKQNANRAANLVRQLLAFSRKQTMQPKVHALTEAMSDLGNLLGRVLGEKVELRISHERDLGLVLVDIHQFEQVMINLAVNARDAMPNGGDSDGAYAQCLCRSIAQHRTQPYATG